MDISTINAVVGILGSLSGVIYLVFYLREKYPRKRRKVDPHPPIIIDDRKLVRPPVAPFIVAPIRVDGATEFVKNEQAYQDWLKQNLQGFVINTHAKQDKRKEYTALHKASCTSISRYTDRVTSGAYTERDFIKVCANDIASLARWAARIGRTGEPFSGVCGLCKPPVPTNLIC
jgi:hypothetical protein